MKLLVVFALASLACLNGVPAARGQDVPKGRVTDVPDDVRKAVMDYMQKIFVYPALVIWKFDYIQPYPTNGIAVCGRLNFPDSTRHYIGQQQFFAHMHDGEVSDAGIVALRQNEDPVLAAAKGYRIACSTR